MYSQSLKRWRTYFGMAQITIIVTMTMMIIENFVLTGRVSPVTTAENFGRHRAAGRHNKHPSLYQFSYDSNMIGMSKNVAPVTGNSKGAHQGKRKPSSWTIVDQEPLPKRRK